MNERVLFSTYTEYEEWLKSNHGKVIEYIKANDVSFRNVEISARAFNALKMNRLYNLSDILFMSYEEICHLDLMDKATAEEIITFRRHFLRQSKNDIIEFIVGEETQTDTMVETATPPCSIETETVTDVNGSSEIISVEHSESSDPITTNDSQGVLDEYTVAIVREILTNAERKQKLKEYLTKKKVSLEELKPSVRTFNALRRGDVHDLADALDYYPDEFTSFRNMGQKSVDEIKFIIEKHVADNLREITAIINGEEYIREEESDPFKLTIQQLLEHAAFKDKAKKYLAENAILVDQMGLSNRSTNALKRVGILSFYDALSIYPDKISSLPHVGNKSIDEIKNKIAFYISTIQDTVSAYCSGDTAALYSDEFIYNTTMSCFENIGFKGISFRQIKEAFPEDFEEARIKKRIGSLLADKVLEYVDSTLYRVYPSVHTTLEESSLDEDDKEILKKKLSGMTFDAIGKEYDLTRERVRQKFNKNLEKLREELQVKYGHSTFDEDYYAYLYTNYEVAKEFWLNYLGVSEKVYLYLFNSQTKGNKPIEDSLCDPKIDLSLKFKIQGYLDRNKILLDGVLVQKQRAAIEDFVLSKCCRDEVTFDEFTELYNDLLKSNNVEYDENLYYTDDVRKTRTHRLTESRYCLWKQGEKVRFYDIDARDYEELLQTINLKRYENTEISTLKLTEDFPEVMEKYDIRDHYELHNLLKKIIKPEDYHDIDIRRQPIIRFGEFDREKALYDIMEAVSPVTANELADYIHMEFGYDKTTILITYLQKLSEFYHQGIYRVDFKRIPDDRFTIFKNSLTEDFYYISDIKKQYKEMFGSVDIEEVNPFTLKSMGFTVLATYAIQNFNTAEAYFMHLLTSRDVYDISEFNSKWNNLTTYYAVYRELRQNYDIFLFDRDQAITMNRLSKLGITKDDIRSYCDEVYDFVDDDTYFTVHSLREAGFSSKLDDLGFDDYFYAGILAVDSRFAWQHIYGVIGLTKNISQKGSIISKKSFLVYALSKYDSVDIDDFISDFADEYGINITDRYEVTGAATDTELYFDPIMNKMYKNKTYYYAEFDD